MKIQTLCLACIIVTTGCRTKLCSRTDITGTGRAAHVKSGPVSAPCNKEKDVAQAYQMAVDVIYSDKFAQSIRDFVNPTNTAIAKLDAWRDVDSNRAVQNMRTAIDGISISTYGGIWGWTISVFAGNIAKEGLTNGPILINRWPLRGRDVPSIANTIVHETAHRAGLTHPTKHQLEPAYYIGNLVETLARDDRR
jgi:hypothetical protein